VRVYWDSGRRFNGRLLAELSPYRCDRVEAFRQAEIAEWRRRAHRIAVFKALVLSGLIFLICASAALIAYALEW